MSGTIYWHDYETFGANPSVDRPSQFAGIRTNTDLEIVGDPLMIYCKPVADMLPSVDACLITGITPQLADDKGLPEPEFIRRIHSEFIRPQTCGAGYNSLRFDDEVTRYTLYRNFYDPYAREWQNGNSRWDIIDMVRLAYALRPESLVWPERETGVPSFKLELLSEANKLEHESAHDALSDVLATIGLARLIKEREPGLFDYCWNARKKTEVSKKIDLRAHKPLVHVSSKIPASQGCTTIVMPLVMHPANKNA
ncbi:MAG: exodeoxyribonuclease I, partial [Pseudomonadales bacterium]